MLNFIFYPDRVTFFMTGSWGSCRFLDLKTAGSIARVCSPYEPTWILECVCHTHIEHVFSIYFGVDLGHSRVTCTLLKYSLGLLHSILLFGRPAFCALVSY
jgi:hypothetical protein